MDRTAVDKFFELLRAGLRETSVSGFSATPQEWGAILWLAREQTVTGILYTGIARLPEEKMPPVPQRMTLLVEIDQIAKRTERVREVAEQLLADLRAAGLHPVIMKGPEAGKYYPAPSLRTSGDIDIFLNMPEYAQALSLLSAHGIAPLRAPDGSHVYQFGGVTVEHHPRYYDVHVRPEKLPAIPSPEAELLMFSAHILKHAIGAGVGLRQFCDIAEAYMALKGQYDCKLLLAAIEHAGMRRWHDLLCSFLQEHLGVPENALPTHKTVRTSGLYEIVLSGGNFGQHRKGLKRGKLQTLKAFLRRLPFSLRIAPRETFRTITELAQGNLH